MARSSTLPPGKGLMSLIGTLEDFRIADVLRLFAAGRKSGLLGVASAGGQALVRFQNGAVVHATAGGLCGDEAVLDLFGWRQGQLTFVPEERAVEPNVSRDVDALILEGLRVGETLRRMKELISSDRVAFQMGAGPRDEAVRLVIGPSEWRVLRLLDGVRDVGELVEETQLPRGEVARVLFELSESGFLERVLTLRVLRVAPQGPLVKDDATVDARLQAEWLKVARFARGVYRVEVRSSGARVASLPVSFRPGLMREVHLPRKVVSELGVLVGEDVTVRPVG